MTVFRPDGHLTDAALAALARGEPLEELRRLELAEHLAYCDRCLQQYAALLTDSVLIPPSSSAEPGLRQKLRRRMLRRGVSRYAAAAAALALALTVLWGSAALPGRMPPAGRPTPWEQAGDAFSAWADDWPRQLADALSGIPGLFDAPGGQTPQTDLTQGGLHS